MLTRPPGRPPPVPRTLASLRPQLLSTRLPSHALAPLVETVTAVKIARRAKLYLARLILRMITHRFHLHNQLLRRDFAPLAELRV